MKDRVRNLYYWGSLWLATQVGTIPSHAIRDAFYRNFLGIKLPSSSIIYWRARFFSPRGIHIGEHSIVGDHAFLDGRMGIFIGSNVNIASEVRIWTEQHDTGSSDFGVSGGQVRIGDWAFIGSRVTILPGVSIGEGTVVGAGAVVARDLPAWSIAVGVPAKVVKQRPVLKYQLDTTKRALFQ